MKSIVILHACVKYILYIKGSKVVFVLKREISSGIDKNTIILFIIGT